MAYQIKDTSGEIKSGALYLPQAKTVPVGAPIVGVAIAPLREELTALYGPRFVVEETKAKPAPTAPTAPAQTKAPSRKATEGKEETEK